jgi:hypothetical protein
MVVQMDGGTHFNENAPSVLARKRSDPKNVGKR